MSKSDSPGGGGEIKEDFAGGWVASREDSFVVDLLGRPCHVFDYRIVERRGQYELDLNHLEKDNYLYINNGKATGSNYADRTIPMPQVQNLNGAVAAFMDGSSKNSTCRNAEAVHGILALNSAQLVEDYVPIPC